MRLASAGPKVRDLAGVRANALAAGFTLEAAVSFSAALERFYEFGVKVILLHRGRSFSDYEAMFKEMARQSERQLGAFLALHALELGAAYRCSPKITEFRNLVIHKGFIPTPEETRDFCRDVYAEIFRAANLLQRHCESAMATVVTEDVQVRSAKVPNGTPVATVVGTSFFSLAASNNKATFAEAFANHLTYKASLSQAIPHLKALHRSLMETQQRA